MLWKVFYIKLIFAFWWSKLPFLRFIFRVSSLFDWWHLQVSYERCCTLNRILFFWITNSFFEWRIFGNILLETLKILLRFGSVKYWYLSCLYYIDMTSFLSISDFQFSLEYNQCFKKASVEICLTLIWIECRHISMYWSKWVILEKCIEQIYFCSCWYMCKLTWSSM